MALPNQTNTAAIWTTGRMVLVILAVALVSISLMCISEFIELHAEFERAQTAHPMEAVIDLSEPGRFIFSFNQSYSKCVGEAILLLIPQELLNQKPKNDLLVGLNTKIEIIDKKDKRVIGVDSRQFDLGSEDINASGSIPIFRLHPFREGEYEAVVTVTQGASRLSGVPQQLEASYMSHPGELMPAYFILIVGAFSLMLGGTTALIVFRRVRKVQNAALA